MPHVWTAQTIWQVPESVLTLRIVYREATDALPAPEPLDVEILAEDTLLPVGQISAIIGPTIVVQVRHPRTHSVRLLLRQGQH